MTVKQLIDALKGRPRGDTVFIVGDPMRNSWFDLITDSRLPLEIPAPSDEDEDSWVCRELDEVRTYNDKH